eukprot:1192416-Prorocentrum_minimum.AAC.1
MRSREQQGNAMRDPEVRHPDTVEPTVKSLLSHLITREFNYPLRFWQHCRYHRCHAFRASHRISTETASSP